jgi:tRNA U34 5-methylaminomethyl-2-thiouridine-forming methyltransferase MnmC
VLEFVTTNDGSKTIYNSVVGEHYHSKHGALQESLHVFLNSGLVYYLQDQSQHNNDVSILEVGLGTGLNFLVTADYCTSTQTRLNYTGIEAYPLSEELIGETGYKEYVTEEVWSSFISSYPKSFNHTTQITPFCSLITSTCRLLEFKSDELFDVLYFDAFAAIHQPEMWSLESLEHIAKYLKPGGVFVTYAITGNLKRTMKSLGFSIQKVPGAPGKREMLRAVKM